MIRHNILVVTDHLDGPPSNGSQVMASAVIAGLTKWFNIRTIVEEDKDSLPALFPDQISLVYNFGCTIFSSALTARIHSLQPNLPIINHFQLVLPEYARNEGYDQTGSDTFGQDSITVAEAAACNIFPSFSEMNRVIRLGWPILSTNNCVIPNAFVPAPLGAPVNPAPGGAPVNPAPSSFRFMAAGRFSDYVKGADLLYRAFCEYYTRNSDAHLYIAGNDQRFIRLLRNIPSHAWTFLGWLERADLHAWLREVDVLIVPSRYEPFGMIAVEAMALGTPVIAMAIGGLAETIHHGHTGWLCDPQEGSAGLRQAMEEAKYQKARLPQMGINAMNAVESAFSLDNMIKEIRKLFDNILFKHEFISC
jgi:glycosyltransferase involved in cell wall biosynthesis